MAFVFVFVFFPFSIQSGELDGFAVLNALIKCGFQVQRLNRMQLLRAAEDLGGRVTYPDLFRLLLNTCAEWTSEERSLVSKILKAMGSTVHQRRLWLAKLRSLLMKFASTGRGEVDESERVDVADASVSPAAFLRCIRDCGLVLSVDEEALLLDCLDTEQLALRLSVPVTMPVPVPVSMGITAIRYKSFVEFCARHCGHWHQAVPEVDAAIRAAMDTCGHPSLAVQELFTLMRSFDDARNDFLSRRTFGICCRRSRLLATLPDYILQQLEEALSLEGGGRIQYPLFDIYLRGICAVSRDGDGQRDVALQLIRNAVDGADTLRPLRKWLLRHDQGLLTEEDLTSLLREFDVVSTKEQLRSFFSFFVSGGRRDEEGLLPSDLLKHLLESRPHWSRLHRPLFLRMQAAFAAMEQPTATLTWTRDPSTPREKRASIRRMYVCLKTFSSRDQYEEEKGRGCMVEKDVFATVLRNAGISLTEEDLAKLADATDCDPFAARIDCDVLLDLLFAEPEADFVHTGKEERSRTRTGTRTDAAEFAVEHMRSLLWNSAARLGREHKEWETDVRTLFNGLDHHKKGVVSLEDFQMGLGLLNASVNETTLLDFTGGSRYIHVDEALDLLLLAPPKRSANNINNHHSETRDTIRVKVIKKKELSSKESSPLSKLIHMIRKRLHQFIVTEQNMEEAWVTLIQVFQRFDPLDSSQVSPRDFFLAVSVLMDGDEAMLSQSDWSEVVECLQSREERDLGHRGEPVMVDYMLFCEKVLDPSELARTFTTENDKNSKIERGKRLLSAKTKRDVKLSAEVASRSAFDGSVNGQRIISNRRGMNGAKSGSSDAVIASSVTSAMSAYKFADRLNKKTSENQQGQVSRDVPVKSAWKTDRLFERKPDTLNKAQRNRTVSFG